MSCLFQSLGRHVRQDPELLRQIVCNFLARSEYESNAYPSNMQFGNCFQTDTTPHTAVPLYVSHMRKSSTWGGAIEIQAFCDVYRYRVHCQILTNGKTTTFVPSDGIYLKECTISWNGGHYEPVV